MVKPYDKQRLATAIQDYKKQKSNYHFNNWELEELERCEKEIRSVIDIYSDNISDLVELDQEFVIQEFLPESLKQRIQDYHAMHEDNMNVFYSFDGQQFSTMEEAAERNELIQNNMIETSITR